MATKILDNTNLGYLISKIKAAFWPKTDVVQIGIDTTPTQNSSNLITSGGVYNELEDVALIDSSASSSLSPLQLEKTTNKVTSISASSTDAEYPSAKAVYDLFTSLQNQ